MTKGDCVAFDMITHAAHLFEDEVCFCVALLTNSPSCRSRVRDCQRLDSRRWFGAKSELHRNHHWHVRSGYGHLFDSGAGRRRADSLRALLYARDWKNRHNRDRFPNGPALLGVHICDGRRHRNRNRRPHREYAYQCRHLFGQRSIRRRSRAQ